MKKSFVIFLIFLFAFPAFGPWMPHSALNELHVQQEKHHARNTINHHHDTQASIKHSIHFDVVTYFNDYLHIDLQQANHATWNSVSLDIQFVDHMAAGNLSLPSQPSATAKEIRGPPEQDWRLSSLATPVYFSTQRFRI